MTVNPELAQRLTVAELAVLGSVGGIDSWPVVLDLWRDPSHAGTAAVGDPASSDSLHRRGLMECGELSMFSTIVLGTMARAEREIEMRSITGAGIRRGYLARRGYDHILALRDGEDVELSVINVSALADLGAAVARFCGQHPAMEFTEFATPLADFTAATENCSDDEDLASAMLALGACPADARRLGSAISQTTTRTEIVAVARKDGAMVQTSGAIGVLDSDRGRILLVPSKSPDGSRWVTVTPGQADRIGRAVPRLIETFPRHPWFR